MSSVSLIESAASLSRINSLLLDLDGTIVNSTQGIRRCINYALTELGYSAQPADRLEMLIGAPLREIFAALLDSADTALVERAIELYRKRYSDVGMYEAHLYPGIAECIRTLHKKGFALYVVTVKPTVYAEQVLRFFKLLRYFNGIYGPTLDGAYTTKEQLVERACREHAIEPSQALMIGDRYHDVCAARAHSISVLGVSYGYGGALELRDAAADIVCDSPGEVEKLLCQLSREWN